MKIASIDIGTNTVIMVVVEILSSKKISILKNIYSIPRIGKGLTIGGNISDEKIDELFSVLTNYVNEANNFKVDKILLTATNAFRIARNSPKIVEQVFNKFGIEIEIVSGKREAELAYLGATYELNENSLLGVIDIGGGSTELTIGNNKILEFSQSLNLGVVSLSEKYFSIHPPSPEALKNAEAEIKSVIKKFDVFRAPQQLIAIAGTPTTLACIKAKLDQFDEEKIAGASLSLEEIANLIEIFSSLSLEEISNRFKSVIKNREDLILSGSLILFHVMNYLKINKVLVSTKGIRYGAIYDYLEKIN